MREREREVKAANCGEIKRERGGKDGNQRKIWKKRN
jgi:hypothetical protein